MRPSIVRLLPNLQYAVFDGQRLKACTRCIRSKGKGLNDITDTQIASKLHRLKHPANWQGVFYPRYLFNLRICDLISLPP